VGEVCVVSDPTSPERTPGERERETKLREAGDWLMSTCRIFGVEEHVAHEVTAVFLAGLRREWETKEAK
jgi:hypothetical protein